MHVDVSESGQGGCNAVQFILKSFAIFYKGFLAERVGTKAR